MRETSKTSGFTLVELMIVLVILTIVSGISVPIILNRQTEGTKAAMTADLNTASAKIVTLVGGWGGRPPAQVTVASTAGTWTAARGGTTDATGQIAASGATLSGTVWADGSWCLQEAHPDVPTMMLRSDRLVVTTDVCPSGALGGAGTISGSTAANLPGKPSGLLVSAPQPNTMIVSWGAVSGAVDYTVLVPGINPIVTAATTVTVPNVQPGTQTVSVRARNSDGTGEGAVATVDVAGPHLTVGDLSVSGGLTVGSLTNTAWQPVAAAPGWATGPVTQRKTVTGELELRGVATRTSGSSSHMLTLPVDLRPASDATVLAWCGSDACPVTVSAASGHVSVVLPGGQAAVSLDGFRLPLG